MKFKLPPQEIHLEKMANKSKFKSWFTYWPFVLKRLLIFVGTHL